MDAIIDTQLSENWDELYGANPKGTNSFKVYYCEAGCMAYSGNFTKLTHCPVCEIPKNKNNYFYYYSIRSYIRKLVRDKENAEILFRDLTKASLQDEIVSDFWTSDGCREIRKREIVGPHSTKGLLTPGCKYFSTDTEIALALYTEASEPDEWSEWTPGDYVSLALSILNIPVRAGRSKDEIFSPYMYFRVPEFTEGIYMNSFYTPLTDDLAEMGMGFSAVDGRTNKEINVRAHLTMISGNHDAIKLCMGYIGHTAEYPCGFCTVRMYSIGWENPEQTFSLELFIRYKSAFICTLGSLVMPFSVAIDFVDLHEVIEGNFIKALTGKYLEPNQKSDYTMLPEKQNLLNETVSETLNNYLPEDLRDGEFPRHFFGGQLPAGFHYPFRIMKSIAWKTIANVFPLLWWNSYIKKHTGHEVTYRYDPNPDGSNSRPPFNRILNYSESFYNERFVEKPIFKRQKLMNIITEELLILRLFELSSMKRADVERVYDFSMKSQKMLEEIIGTETDGGLEIFSIHLHMMLHLQDSTLRSGMVKHYWASPIEGDIHALNKVKFRFRNVLIDQGRTLGLRYANRFIHDLEDPIKLVTGIRITKSEHFTRSGFKSDIAGLVIAAINKRIVSFGGLVPDDRVFSPDECLFSKPSYFHVSSEATETTFKIGSIAKIFLNGEARYGECVEFVTYDADGNKLEMNFVVLELIQTYPILTKSVAWCPGKWITIGQLKCLKVEKKEIIVVNAEDLLSECYLLPATDSGGNKSRDYEYIHDRTPFTIDEIIREATDKEQEFILFNPNSNQLVHMDGKPRRDERSLIYHCAPY